MMEWADMKQAMTILVQNPEVHHNIPKHIVDCIRSDPVFGQLLDRVPASNPHGSTAEGKVSQRLQVHKPQPNQVLCQADLAVCNA